MSKITNTIKTLNLLRENRKMKTTELAATLHVEQRMARVYIDELREIGYDISSKPGANGGYVLHDVILNDNEQLALYEALKLLESTGFERIEDFKSAYKKIEYKFKSI